MARVLGDEADADDRAELKLLLDSNPILKQHYQRMAKIWHLNSAMPPATQPSDNFGQNLQKIIQKGNEEYSILNKSLCYQPQKRFRSYLKYAAAVAVISISVWFYIAKIAATAVGRQKMITVANGKMLKVILPDGTLVWLNAGSKLFYPHHFNGKIRKVRLIGEAFFDVVKDKEHPFIVSTPMFNLKVLGTAFNVSAYPNDLSAEAALVRGKIEVTLIKEPDKRIILVPSEKLTVKNSYSNGKTDQKTIAGKTESLPLIALTNMHLSLKDTLPSEVLWIENKLVFDEEPFENIARKMERRYDVKILFRNEEIKKVTFTGKFKNESIEKALQSLQSIEKFHYYIKNNQVTIF